MSRPARRATALLLATVGVALTTTACGALERAQTTVTVMTSWEATSPEARTFVKVAERYAKDHGFAVAYQGVRAGEAMLEAASANGSPPDIAMLSSPAALASYAGKDIGGLVDLQPDDTIEAAQLLYRADRTDRPYGVIVKTDLKSLVWHASPSLASDYPDTWRELVALGGGLPRDRDTTPWCLGMADGSGSGWVGTDWIEDILLHQSGIEVYRRWATGELPWNSPQVRSAWRAWGDLLVASGGTDAATTATILQTGWADAGRGMFDAEAGVPRCALHHQGSFVPAVYAEEATTEALTFFPFPAFPDTPGAGDDGSVDVPGVEVSVDAAGLFSTKPEARRLLRYLASRQGQEAWIQQAGRTFFSPRTDIDRQKAYGDDGIARQLADRLATAGDRCLDASNFMPSAISEAFSTAVLEYLESLTDPTSDRLVPILEELDRVRASVLPSAFLTKPCRTAQ